MSSDNLRLHDYQIVARDFLRGRDRSALFLDMLPIGLGKTACALTALEPRHLPALVVAPKRVAEHVWEAERALWRPDLSISVAKGSPAGRAASRASGADITVLGRDNIRDITPGDRYRTVILDELSGFKSRSSVRWKTMSKIVWHPRVEHVWGLTGTPSPNGLLDLWPQIALLDRGARLGKNITAYRGRYFRPGRQLPSGIITEWIPRPEAEQNIHRLLEDICLSMETEGRVKLPDVTYNTIEVDLPAPALRTYKEITRQLLVDLRDILGGEVHSATNAAVLTGRLSQISAGFIYSDDIGSGRYTEIHEEKIRAVLEIVEAQGSPVLVFYRFKAEHEMLKRALLRTGKTFASVQDPYAIEEWNQGELGVLLAHPASAGHGLNLQHGGHTIVWSSLPWSLEEWEQGNKRLARQGQKHPVVIHSLIGRRTIDHVIRERLTSKAAVQNALLDHLESPI